MSTPSGLPQTGHQLPAEEIAAALLALGEDPSVDRIDQLRNRIDARAVPEGAGEASLRARTIEHAIRIADRPAYLKVSMRRETGAENSMHIEEKLHPEAVELWCLSTDLHSKPRRPEMLDQMEILGCALLATGWTVEELGANERNVTVEHFHDLVDKGVCDRYCSVPPTLLLQVPAEVLKEWSVERKAAPFQRPITRFDFVQDEQYGPAKACPEAVDFAKGAPYGELAIERSVRPNGDAWYHAYISLGENEFVSLGLGRLLPDEADLRSMAKETAEETVERRARVAREFQEKTARRMQVIAEKGIQPGLQWKGAQTYVEGRKGLTTYDNATVVEINDQNGFVTVECTKRGVRGAHRITTDPTSTYLFDSLPAVGAKSEAANTTRADAPSFDM